ncbi:MAG TPA: hypothetical protein VIK84_05825 [Haloplasmataceae bacterium]
MNTLLIVIGVFMIVLGLFILLFKVIEIIPGYEDSNLKNKKGMAIWVGTNYIIMGMLTVIDAIISINYHFNELTSIIIFTGIIIIFYLITSLGGKKYRKD